MFQLFQKDKKSPFRSQVHLFSNLLIVFGFIAILFSYGSILYSEIWYGLKSLRQQEVSLEQDVVGGKKSVKDSVFARLISGAPIDLDPINTDFSIVIEKLGVNAPIKADVTVTNESAYNNALKEGVAHSSTSQYPSTQPGNTYLFAHSALNFWNFGKYAMVFSLLHKLEVGDSIHIFYKNTTYVYEVMNKEIYKGWDTFPINRAVIEPILTLQTCSPPGTTFNRLVVTAKLKRVVPYLMLTV
ncbi:sortase [candidate division WWE3 bacterium]|nr:sortase [candidate division WWE3 bacterium]